MQKGARTTNIAKRMIHSSHCYGHTIRVLVPTQLPPSIRRSNNWYLNRPLDLPMDGERWFGQYGYDKEKDELAKNGT